MDEYNSGWKCAITEPPNPGVPVLLYRKSWNDGEFTPDGIIPGFRRSNEEPAEYWGGEWNNDFDTWDGGNCSPSHWHAHPSPPCT